jgi:hypothetical protein
LLLFFAILRLSLPSLALRYSLAPLQTDPRFLGLLKEEEEETPGTKEPPDPSI